MYCVSVFNGRTILSRCFPPADSSSYFNDDYHSRCARCLPDREIIMRKEWRKGR